MALLQISMLSKAQSLSNTVWTYTQRTYGNEKLQKVTSLFVFTSQTEVIWLLETPRNYMFPVGIGKYDAQKHAFTFSHTKLAHKRISLYYGEKDIEFDFRINQNNNATLRLTEWNDACLPSFYNDGTTCNLSKEKYTLQPNPNFIGTSWKCDIENQTFHLYFKSKYEVLIDGESHLYVSFGNNMFIKTGDNLRNENLVGIAINDNRLFLRPDGLGVLDNDERYQKEFELKRLE